MRERVLGLRARDVLTRGLDALVEVLREPVADLAAPVERLAGVLRVPVDLRAPDERLAAAPDVRVVRALVPVELFAREEVLRDAVDRPLLARERDALRAPLDRPELDRDEVEPLLEPSSTFHLPVITRCAASATASAISEPSLAALEATLLAACCAVSAASSPASRIARRAFGLALIAAAAAAKPAASISLLIAAFAILSIVSELDERELPERELEAVDLEDLEELLRADFAIFSLPRSRRRHFNAVTVPE